MGRDYFHFELKLNPMENVWDYLRGNKLSHTVWDTYEAIVEACARAHGAS